MNDTLFTFYNEKILNQINQKNVVGGTGDCGYSYTETLANGTTRHEEAWYDPSDGWITESCFDIPGEY